MLIEAFLLGLKFVPLGNLRDHRGHECPERFH